MMNAMMNLPTPSRQLHFCPKNQWRLCLLLALLISPALLHAQKQYNIWFFGRNAGLDFTSGTPVPLFGSALSSREGSASFSDPQTGGLLFYTNGLVVWNRNHQQMPNGDRLRGSDNSVQSGLILPWPGDASGKRYALFISPAPESFSGDPNESLTLSVIDMNADNGLGDVAEKNTVVLPSSSEKLTAVRHCNGRDWWILAHGRGDDRFYAFRLSPKGIVDTVMTQIGAPHSPEGIRRSEGWMKTSPNGKKIAVVVWNNFDQPRPSFVELLDFDNRTGTFSNVIRILNGNGYDYGACFSPDNSKLYISRAHDVAANTSRPFKDTLYQFDLSNPSAAAIINSRQVVGLADSLGTIMAGPDGKLYIAVLAANHLAVISNPNASGAACGFLFNGISLGSMESLWGLPNNVDSYDLPADSACLPPQAMFAPDQLTICVGQCLNFLDRTSNNPTGWEWKFDGARVGSSTDQNPRNICYDTPGSFQVRLIASKPIASDELGYDTTTQTITVNPRPNVTAGRDTTICAGQAVELQGGGDGTLEWDVSADLSCTDCPRPIARPRQTTTYRITARNAAGCVAVDSVTVFIKPAPTITATPDATTLCAGESVQLRATGGSSYRWTPATGLSCADCDAPVASPTSTTQYIVTSSAPGTCDGVDTVLVTVVSSLAVDAGDEQAICRGDSARLNASGAAATYVWQPTTGLSCADCLNPMASPPTTTTYRLTAQSAGACQAADSVTVTVNPAIVANAGEDQKICLGDAAQLHSDSATTYRWTPATGLSCTDCQSPEARPTLTTTYFLRVTNAEGCSDSDQVTVVVDQSPRTARLRIGDYQLPAGSYLRLPIILDDPLDAAQIDSLLLDLTFDDGMMALREEFFAGTLMDGWLAQVIERKPGHYRVLLVATPFTYAAGTGTLVELGFFVYFRNTTQSCLRAQLTPVGNICTVIPEAVGCVTLDPICGANLRFIEISNANFALEGNHPNPFNPTTEIVFSIGLDGPTRLELFDASGNLVETMLDAPMQPGRYAVAWDGSGHPSGLYRYRLTSGHWSASGWMMMVK